MDWDDALSLMTLGAVLPYVSAAAGWWLRRAGAGHASGASAPN
ncbi:MAG: hypothetical protein ACM3Y9_08495 [Ignavibacteria bacterium]